MQDGALPSRRMKGKGPEGQHTEQSGLWKPKKMTKAVRSWGGTARKGSGKGAGGSQGQEKP